MIRQAGRPRQRYAVLAAVGIAAAVLFVALSLQEGIRRDLETVLSSFGAHVLLLASSDKAAIADARTTIGELPYVRDVAVQGTVSTRIGPMDEYWLTWLSVSENFIAVLDLPIAEGAGFGAEGQGVVIGTEVKDAVFGDAGAFGATIDGMRIVGVLSPIPKDDTVREKYNRLVLRPIGEGEQFSVLYVETTRPSDEVSALLESRLPGVTVFPLSSWYAAESYKFVVLDRILLLSGLGTALVASILVAALALLSALRRRREFGIRRAVGSSRRSLVALVSGESLRTSAIGCSAGMATGALAAYLIEGAVPLSWGHALLPLGALAIGVLASCLPAIRAARQDPAHMLRQRGLFSSRETAGWIRAFVALALAVALGCTILVAGIAMASYAYVDSLWGNIDARTLMVRSPVDSILPAPDLSLSDAAALEGLGAADLVVPTAFRSVDAGVTAMAVGEGYPDLGLFTVLSGRDLSADDVQDGRRVCVVSATYADEHGLTMGTAISVRGEEFQIVGVISDTGIRTEIAADIVVPLFYSSLLEPYDTRFLVRARTLRDVAGLQSQIAAAFKAQYPDVAAVSVFVVNAAAADLGAFFRAAVLRLGFIAAALLILAAMEAVTHIRYLLRQRMFEYGVRRCIGASTRDIAVSMLKESLIPAAIGAGVGLAISEALLPLILGWFKILEAPPILLLVATAGGGGLLIVFLGSWPIRTLHSMTPAQMLQRGRA